MGGDKRLSIRGTKNSSEFRSHADELQVDDVLPFLRLAKHYTNELDVMIEAKSKDVALRHFMEKLADVKDIEVLDGASIEVH